MPTLTLIYAILTSTLFLLLYINIYKRYFFLRKHFYFGIFFLLLSIYIQFLNQIVFNFNITYFALLSFITYPISIAMIFKTNFFNNLFLSLNAILKIYIAFVFFGTLYAINNNIQYTVSWISESSYYNLSQGHAYLLSIGSLLINDNFLLKNKLKDFFLLKRNLMLIIFIQLILIINMVWISVSNYDIPYIWYNNVLLLISFSVEIIYFLLRVFTANSSYFSSYKINTETLRKQLSFQLEHYKNYEDQMENFLKFKHDYDKVLSGISNLLVLKDYDSIKEVLNDSTDDLNNIVINYKRYSNNLIIDALLNDYAKRFERINATFSSYTYITLDDMNELKLIKLFYNILENSYEALIQVQNYKDRHMRINSEVLADYVKISFINSMNTPLTNSFYKTTKLDTKNHGFGLSIINDILNEYNGFSNTFITTDNDLSFYNLEIFIPLK